MKQQKHHTAFTLAELLIALSVVSIIATFNIAKIMTAYDVSVQKAKLKTTVSTLQSLGMAAYQSGVRDSDGWINYLNAHLPFIRRQNTACTDAVRYTPYGDSNYVCFQLNNGVKLNVSSNSNIYNADWGPMIFVTTDPRRFEDGNAPFNYVGLALNLGPPVLPLTNNWGPFQSGEMHPPHDWILGCPSSPSDKSCISPESEWAKLFK